MVFNEIAVKRDKIKPDKLIVGQRSSSAWLLKQNKQKLA